VSAFHRLLVLLVFGIALGVGAVRCTLHNVPEVARPVDSGDGGTGAASRTVGKVDRPVSTAWPVRLPPIQPRLGEPLADLSTEQLERFQAGKAAFTRMITAEEGLGPVHNLTGCGVCHSNPLGGSGTITIIMFGRRGANGYDPLYELGGPRFHGESISPQCRETIPRQADVIAPRITSSMLGAGLMEAVPDVAILARAGDPKTDVHGRAHWVRPLEGSEGNALRVGRFGWKGHHATILSFNATAARDELGLTNRLIPEEHAPNGDKSLARLCDEVADPEDVPDAEGFHFIDRVTDFARFLAPPPQTPQAGMRGEVIFHEIGCGDCHVAEFQTADDPGIEPVLRNRMIRPYTDYLLHDMGSLGDGVVQGDAKEHEIRTAPLWGFRIRFPVMHDGRVSGATLEERATRAIMAHAGEAAAAVARFEALTHEEKGLLVRFLDSLGRVEFDHDGDNDVDLTDYRAFEKCLTEARTATLSPDDGCSISDVAQDGNVDLLDFATLQRAFTGPLRSTAMAVP